jgi:hypothetical protein
MTLIAFIITAMKPPSRHRLYEVNLERRTAFCTVCGNTEIVLRETRTRTTPMVYCVAKAKEIREYDQKRLRLAREERRSKPGWKVLRRHVLGKIDPVTMTAICSQCGRTDIVERSGHNGKLYYICGIRRREYGRAYRERRR